MVKFFILLNAFYKFLTKYSENTQLFEIISSVNLQKNVNISFIYI